MSESLWAESARADSLCSGDSAMHATITHPRRAVSINLSVRRKQSAEESPMALPKRLPGCPRASRNSAAGFLAQSADRLDQDVLRPRVEVADAAGVEAARFVASRGQHARRRQIAEDVVVV